jgi:hypothetical protein
MKSETTNINSNNSGKVSGLGAVAEQKERPDELSLPVGLVEGSPEG